MTRPPPLDRFLSTSSEDLRAASPPYRREASSSNLHSTLEVPEGVYAYPPSPAYHSSVDMSEPPPEVDEKVPIDDVKAKPTVHYVDSNTARPAGLVQASSSRFQDEVSSRPPSIAGTDDEEEEEVYDWSGEEDLVDEEAKFEERMGKKQKNKTWGFKRVITLLFSSLIGSVFLAGVLVTPGILVHYYWYLKDPTDHRRYVKQNVQAWLFWAAANLLISWGLALIIDIIPTVIRFIISIIWGHVSERVKTRLELYLSVKNTIKPLLYGVSCWVSWVIIFGNIFDLYDVSDASSSRAGYTKRVYQAIEFLFFFTLVVCAQKMLSHFVAFSFHRTAYKDRVDSVQESLQVIEKLRDYRPKPHSRNRSGNRTPIFGGLTTPFSEREHFNFLSGALKTHAQHDHGEDGDTEDADRTVVGRGSKGKGKNRSSWFGGSKKTKHDDYESVTPEHEMGILSGSSRPISPTAMPISGLPHSRSRSDSPHRYPPVPGTHSPRPSIDRTDSGADTLVQAAKALKSTLLHDARNIKGKDGSEALGLTGVGSAAEAKHLARSIYMKFRDRHRNYLLPSDFHPAFAKPAEAETAFRVFDKDNNGDISRAEIKTTLLKVYKERRFLARSMRDVGAALKTLDQIMLFFAMVILFFISLSVFGVEVGDSLTSVYSLGIAASFIFKNSASNAFDAIMFLFVTHPYDTGDRCFIDEENLVVKKMGLFATVFTRVDGTETYYFNSQLFSKFITNVRRSDKTFENLTMHVAWNTPLAKLDELNECMNQWLATEKNRWFQPSTGVVLQHIDYQRFLEITMGIPHNGNWQDWGLRNARKTAFHAAVQFYCRQLGISCSESPLPIVYADPDTQTYTPSPNLQSPNTGYDVEEEIDIQEESQGSRFTRAQAQAQETHGPEAKPTLGFTPPAAVRPAHSLRARKTMSKKAVLRGMDG